MPLCRISDAATDAVPETRRGCCLSHAVRCRVDPKVDAAAAMHVVCQEKMVDLQPGARRCVGCHCLGVGCRPRECRGRRAARGRPWLRRWVSLGRRREVAVVARRSCGVVMEGGGKVVGDRATGGGCRSENRWSGAGVGEDGFDLEGRLSYERREQVVKSLVLAAGRRVRQRWLVGTRAAGLQKTVEMGERED